MLRPLIAISCDHPGCAEEILRPAPNWNTHPADADELQDVAEEAGWETRPGRTRDLTRHRCPAHRYIPPCPTADGGA